MNSLPARPKPNESLSFTTFVRGKSIRFDRDAINAYMGNPLTLLEPEGPTVPSLCAYGSKCAQGGWNHKEIQKGILFKGHKYDKSPTWNPHKVSFANVTAKVGVIFKFLVHNAWLKSHVSSTTLRITPMIWNIPKGKKVNIARIIANELKHIALSGVTGPKTRLAFPRFIMGLLRFHGVEIPDPAHEELNHLIDDAYIVALARKEQRASSSRAP